MRLSQAAEKFWLTPASPLPLAGLRIGIAFTLLIQAFVLWPSLLDLYGTNGFLQGPLSDYLGDHSLVGLTGLVHWLAGYGLSESRVILGLAGLYAVGLVALLLGWHTHVAALLVFVTHWFLAGGQITSYGVDIFAHIALFYLVWVPAGARLSLDHWQGRVSGEPSRFARVSLRVLQLHLCIAYFAAGFEKALGPQWWNGDAIWRTLMLPLYRQFDFGWLARVPWLAKILGWGTLVVEMGYPIFIWPRRTRTLWILATLGLHLGIGLFMGLGLFSLIMCVLTLAAFAIPAEVKPSTDEREREPERPREHEPEPMRMAR